MCSVAICGGSQQATVGYLQVRARNDGGATASEIAMEGHGSSMEG